MNAADTSLDMRLIVIFLQSLLLFGAAASAAQNTIVVHLDALNGSGEAGTATLTRQGDKTLVVIDLANGTATRQPSHLHAGTCDDYTPRPAYALSDVINGHSRTVVAASLDRLASASLIVNVHKSYDDIATQSACGAVGR